MNISQNSGSSNMNQSMISTDGGEIMMSPLNLVSLIFCFVVIVTGAIGNLMVLTIYGGGWVKARSCGIYLVNMAVANLIGTTIIPTELLLELLNVGVRPIGDFGCRIVSFLATTSISVSAFSLVLVTITRHVIMSRPSRKTLPIPLLVVIVFLIWVLGASVGVIYLLGNRIRLHDEGDISVCRSFAQPDEHKIHTLVTFTLQVVLPLLVMLLLCTSMATSKTDITLLQDEGRTREEHNRHKKATRILLLIVVVFFVCQIPVNVFYFLDMFDVLGVVEMSIKLRVYTSLHMLQMANNCINPVIYFTFRRHLEAVTSTDGGVANEFILNTYVIE